MTTNLRLALLSIPVAALAIAASCKNGIACTEIGCGSGLTVSVESGEEWPAGAYSLDATLDGAKHHCEVRIPAESDPVSCESQGALIALERAGFCPEEEVHGDDSRSQGPCTPIPGHYVLRLSAFEGPKKLQLVLERDDVVLIDESRVLEYEDVYPNGPDCDGHCRQANVSLSF
jgi:hypothetical protein